jgi:hypothetical protein
LGGNPGGCVDLTISELGSLGEFVASLAVLISLVILIYQVRAAKLEFSSQITREIQSSNNQAFWQLSSQPGLMDLHIRAQRDLSSISEADALTWMTWLYTWIIQTEDGWKERERGVPNMEFVDRYLFGVASVLRSDGGKLAWPRLRPFYDEDFICALEQVVREGEATYLDMLLSDLSVAGEDRRPS